MNNLKKFNCFEDFEFEARGSITERNNHDESNLNLKNSNNNLYANYIKNINTLENKYQTNISNTASSTFMPFANPKTAEKSNNNVSVNTDK